MCSYLYSFFLHFYFSTVNINRFDMINFQILLWPFISHFPIHPCRMNLNINDLLWVNGHRIFFQNNKIRKFAFLQRSNNILHMALKCSIACHSHDGLIRRNTLIRVKYLASCFDSPGYSIMYTSKWINRLAIIIRMYCRLQT